jgi:hypothetical protein
MPQAHKAGHIRPVLAMSAVPTALTRPAAQWTADRYGEEVHLVVPETAGHPAALRESYLKKHPHLRARVLVTLHPQPPTLE